MAKIVNPQSKKSISEVAEWFDLTLLLSRSFSELSDGEKQRVMLARGVVQSPKWLILDETFSKMDLERSFSVSQLMKKLVENGMGVVLSSHDLNLLSEVADEVWFMKDGKILATGTIENMVTTENLEKLFPTRVVHVVRSPENGKKKVIY